VEAISVSLDSSCVSRIVAGARPTRPTRQAPTGVRVIRGVKHTVAACDDPARPHPCTRRPSALKRSQRHTLLLRLARGSSSTLTSTTRSSSATCAHRLLSALPTTRLASLSISHPPTKRGRATHIVLAPRTFPTPGPTPPQAEYSDSPRNWARGRSPPPAPTPSLLPGSARTPPPLRKPAMRRGSARRASHTLRDARRGERLPIPLYLLAHARLVPLAMLSHTPSTTSVPRKRTAPSSSRRTRFAWSPRACSSVSSAPPTELKPPTQCASPPPISQAVARRGTKPQTPPSSSPNALAPPTKKRIFLEEREKRTTEPKKRT
jgi:hypothetical protein